MEQNWIVSEEFNLQRIDRYMSELHGDLSRSRVQALLKDEYILVNGLPTKSNYKVKTGDAITLEVPCEEQLGVEAEDIPLDICYEDSDVIVVNKEKGMVVHPAVGNQSGTLVHALLHHCKDLSGINGILRPGIVHRIDKDTTGLLIVAKNDHAHQELVKQLQDKSVGRLYYALVHGVIAHDHGTIDAPIGRDPKDRQKMGVVAQNSREARTYFTVIERFENYTLVECRLDTGRTHQIRVHMQYIKHPVVGDQKYSYRKTMEVGGQLLHAHQLTFIHPVSKQSITVEAPMPKVFSDVLEELRKEER